MPLSASFMTLVKYYFQRLLHIEALREKVLSKGCKSFMLIPVFAKWFSSSPLPMGSFLHAIIIFPGIIWQTWRVFIILYSEVFGEATPTVKTLEL